MTVSFPARPKYVSVARLMAGRLGMIHDLTVADIADLSLVVDEVCTTIMGVAMPSSELECTVELKPAQVKVIVTAPSAACALPHRDAMAWRLLDTLTDSVVIDVGPGQGGRHVASITAVLAVWNVRAWVTGDTSRIRRM